MTEIPTDRFVCENQVRVRYAETDAMGIVHHSSYIVYFEEGRTHYARERGQPYSIFEASGYYLAVTGVHVRYHKSARYEQLLTLKTWVTEMKSRGLTFEYVIMDNESGDVLVTGSTEHICLNRDGKISRLPDSWRTWG